MTLVVLVTVPPERAQEFARTLVHQRFAGCVNIVSAQSTYRWDDGVVEEPEALLVIKTTGERYPELEAKIKEMHPYEIPEILALASDREWPDFQQWIVGATKSH